MNDRDELLESWYQEETWPFAGWDFSHLNNRLIKDKPPWSYLERAAVLMQGATSVVDLDTGGGERLLALQSHWNGRIVATEAYPPNARLSHRNLSAAGGQVVLAHSDGIRSLPFASRTFDLLLNRHGGFNCAEVARILTPGGTFLTRQVNGMSAHDLLAVFGASPQWPDASPEKYVPLLEQAGLTITDMKDWQGTIRFTDVGAIVYYLKAITWLVPGFNVRTHQDALFSLQARLESGKNLTFYTGTYLIEAQKRA
jgi:SAM-dependent methyltransferase